MSPLPPCLPHFPRFRLVSPLARVSAGGDFFQSTPFLPPPSPRRWGDSFSPDCGSCCALVVFCLGISLPLALSFPGVGFRNVTPPPPLVSYPFAFCSFPRPLFVDCCSLPIVFLYLLSVSVATHLINSSYASFCRPWIPLVSSVDFIRRVLPPPRSFLIFTSLPPLPLRVTSENCPWHFRFSFDFFSPLQSSLSFFFSHFSRPFTVVRSRRDVDPQFFPWVFPPEPLPSPHLRLRSP